MTATTAHHVPAECAECVKALCQPAYAAQCGHPEALLIAKCGFTAKQAAAWATTMSLAQILAI